MPDRIETARLILRPLEERDFVSLVASLNNPRIVEGTGSIPWPYDLDDARAHFMRIRDLGPGNLNAVVECRDRPGAVIGSVGCERTRRAQEAELGYWFAESCWGRGIGIEAARAAADHAFRVLGIERLVAGYRHGNEASRRILDRLGFRLTGHTTMYSAGIRRTVPVARLELSRREWLRLSHPV